jgi:hypothetical protein
MERGPMAGKDNTTRIETLETQSANLAARLDVFGAELRAISELLRKAGTATEGHTLKITVLEQQVTVITALKDSVEALKELKTELKGLQKDIEVCKNWQEEEKLRRLTWGNRLWMLLPPLLGVIVGSLLTAFLSYTFLKK